MSPQKPTVSMVFHLGDEVLTLGKCHPAQARILVQKELATWEDGNLKVILRKAQSQVFDFNHESLLRGPSDNANVSPAEMDRRIDWFKYVVLKTTMAAGDLYRPGQDVAPEEMAAYKEAAKALNAIATTEASEYQEVDGKWVEVAQKATDLDIHQYYDKDAPPPEEELDNPFNDDLTTKDVNALYHRVGLWGIPSDRASKEMDEETRAALENIEIPGMLPFDWDTGERTKAPPDRMDEILADIKRATPSDYKVVTRTFQFPTVARPRDPMFALPTSKDLTKLVENLAPAGNTPGGDTCLDGTLPETASTAVRKSRRRVVARADSSK